MSHKIRRQKISKRSKTCDKEDSKKRITESGEVRSFHGKPLCDISREQFVAFVNFITGGRKHIKQQSIDICEDILALLPSKCLRGWTITKKLGQGSFGAVFLVSKGTKTAAIKICVSNPDREFMSPKEEVELQRVFYKHHLAPKVLCYSSARMFGKEIHFILMEQVDITLNKILCKVGANKEQLEQIFMSIAEALQKMQKYRLTHGDMHSENIAFNEKKDGGYELVFIDFGQSSNRTSDLQVDIEQLISDLFQIDRAPQAMFFATRLQYFIEKVLNLSYKIQGTRSTFFNRHKEYEPKLGQARRHTALQKQLYTGVMYHRPDRRDRFWGGGLRYEEPFRSVHNFVDVS